MGRLTAAVDPAEVTVQYGPEKRGDWRDKVIVVAWSTDDRPAFTVETSAPRGYRPNDEEGWNIACVIGAADGSSEGAVLEADRKAAGLLAVVRHVLAADMTLDGTCGYATIGTELNWWHAVVGTTAESTIAFTVRGRAIL
jgi:hypothetical protein